MPTYDKVREKSFPIVSGVKGMTFALIDFSDAPDVLGALKPSQAPEYELDGEWSPSFKGALYYKKLDSMVQENEPTIHTIQARMITNQMEDPGTGSACCALACYLATNAMKDLEIQTTQDAAATDADLATKTEGIKLEDSTPKAGSTKDESKEERPKRERHVYAIQQGVEMGRMCTIAVEVDLEILQDGAKKIANVTLSGRANTFATGELVPHP